MPVTAKDIQNLVQSMIDEEHLKLCEVKVSGNPRRPLIQFFIDREQGFITIEECVSMTRMIQDLLSMQDNVPSEYRIEVSSPGIDFPLRELWQYRKNIGRMISYLVSENCPDPGRSRETGTIARVSEEGTIYLETEDSTLEFSISDLENAQVIIESPGKGKSKRKRHETRRR